MERLISEISLGYPEQCLDLRACNSKMGQMGQGMSLAQRRESVKTDLTQTIQQGNYLYDYLDIPTYIRRRVTLSG